MKKFLFWLTTYFSLVTIGLILINPLISQEEICGVIQDKMQPTYYSSNFILRNRVIMSIKNVVVIKCDDNSVETINNVEDNLFYSKEIGDSICLKRVNGDKYLIYLGIISLLITLVITLFFTLSFIESFYYNYIKR